MKNVSSASSRTSQDNGQPVEAGEGEGRAAEAVNLRAATSGAPSLAKAPGPQRLLCSPSSLGWMVTGPLKGEPGWLVWGDTAGGSVRALFPTLPMRHLAGGGLLRAKWGLWRLTKRPALATRFIPTERRWGPFTSSLTPGSAPPPPHLTSEEGLRSFPTWSWGPSRAGAPLGPGACHLPRSLVDRAQVIWARTQGPVHWQRGLERLTHQWASTAAPKTPESEWGGGACFLKGVLGLTLHRTSGSSPGHLLVPQASLYLPDPRHSPPPPRAVLQLDCLFPAPLDLWGVHTHVGPRAHTHTHTPHHKPAQFTWPPGA